MNARTAETLKAFPGCFQEVFTHFYRVYVTRELAQNSGLVSGSGANFQDPVSGIDLKNLSHQCNDIGLRNCLLRTDVKRGISVCFRS